MRSNKAKILILAAVMLLASCKQHGSPVSILRVDKLLFETPQQELPAKLAEVRQQFPSPFLHIYPNDPEYLELLQGFVSDSTMRQIYQITESRYGKLDWLESELGDALQKAAELDDEIGLDHFAAYITGIFDHDSRVVVDVETRSLIISLDQYALPQMERYAYFGLPLFIVNQCDSAYLVTDIMAELARQYIATPDKKDITMLDLMIMEGKAMYFLDKVLPHKADYLKMRYTPDQLDWCRRNEGMIWAYFIQHNMLYEKDFTRFHNFIDDAPKTNAFKDSAPRTPQYIGWQIVRQYMENNKCTIKELFENTNSQAILSSSKYKP